MNRRWLWLLLAVPLIAGLVRLRFDADVLNLLPADVPAVRGLQWHQRHFANSRSLLITLHGADAEVVTAMAREVAAALSAQTNLVQSALWQPPWLDHPGDAAENLAWLWLQRPPAELAAMSARLTGDALTRHLAETREALATSLDPQELARASYDPLGFTQLPSAVPGGGFDQGNGVFVGDEGRFRVVYVDPANPDMNYREAAAWLDAVRGRVAQIVDGESRVTIAYTGGPAFLSEIATGMESDLRNSVLTTLAVIAVLFWLAHRSLRPLLCLLAALGVTLVGTLALGGLVFGTLNVVSAGFAAVLLGLAVDYGLVGYQEARAHPGESLPRLRRRIAKGVGWSAATTAGTFFLLRFAGLPGLAQLGALTAMGLLLGAVVMLYGFLPLAIGRGVVTMPASAEVHANEPTTTAVLWPTALIVVVAIAVLGWRGLPAATSSAEPLRPRNSSAYAAMESLQQGLGQTNKSDWLMFRGTTPDAVASQLHSADTRLGAAAVAGRVQSFQLPVAFWPMASNAAVNPAAARELSARAESVRDAVQAAGFTSNSLALADGVFAAWQRWTQPNSVVPLWPTNSTARWLTGQFAARAANGDWLAVGTVAGAAADLGRLGDGVIVTSWERLGQELLTRVSQRVGWLTALVAGGLVGSLWLAFRRWSEVLLSVAGLALSFLLLLAVMSAFGASWNLLNLVAIPVLLGSSVDSTIHVQLALRRTGDNRAALWRSIGRALLLCAGANIAGFGSLAWSNNAGLASLDLVCAGGVACVFVVSMGLLPAWWRRAGHTVELEPAEPSTGPSELYRGGPWRLASWFARRLPRGGCQQLARLGVGFYCAMRPQRVAVVVENLLPLTGGDRGAAERLAKENFREFADKLTDLWRFEAGVDVAPLVAPGSGWDHFTAAVAAGRGVLLVTPHLGNWEFGAVLLRRQGISPLVLTAPEPGETFTAARADGRARHGIETLVVGADPFAFVQVIQRLQRGGVVALLVDRPPIATRVRTDLFGRSFHVSVAAAELARATGCVVLPVFVVREADGYRAHALPPLDYDRRDLASRATRAEFAGLILRAFEPTIRQFAAQWFHFVPIWPKAKTTDETGMDSR